jgi:hypothetical protein
MCVSYAHIRKSTDAYVVTKPTASSPRSRRARSASRPQTLGHSLSRTTLYPWARPCRSPYGLLHARYVSSRARSADAYSAQEVFWPEHALTLREIRAVLAALVRRFDLTLAPSFPPADWTARLEDRFILEIGPLLVVVSRRTL